jgi:hypothetical protein
VCAADPVNGVDQRGVTRPQGTACDIGAYEAVLPNTPAGSDVVVALPDSGMTLTFDTVSTPGTTTVTVSSSGPTPPVGVSLGDPATYFDISTTATYVPPIVICIAYDPMQYTDPSNLRLLHYENDTWVDVTTSNDTVNYSICGQTSSLSPFIVAQSKYHFTGFFQPVDNVPTVNSVKAGSAIRVKFSLGGDQGLNIFAADYPKSQVVPCDSTAPVTGIEETVTANASGLSYDPDTGRYTYTWKTNKAWEGTCRQLIVKLNDGSYQRANFKFTR